MPLGKLPMLSSPRYFKATAVTTLATAVIPVAIIAIGAIDFNQGDPVEASEAQGAFIFIIHAIASILFTAAAFPFAGWYLHHRSNLIKGQFYKVVSYVLIVASLLCALMLALSGFGLSAFIFTPFSLAFIAIFSFPFRPLWLRLAL